MGNEAYAFWGTAAIPALGPFLINLVVRKSEVLKSSGADFLLLLLAFDLTGILTSGELAKFVPNPAVKALLLHFAVASLLFTFCLWLIVVREFEPRYRAAPTGRGQLAKSVLFFGLTWAVTAVLTFCHIYVFVYREM